MTGPHQGLYPIVRRVRRPLLPIEAGTTAPVVVPAKPAEPQPAQQTPKSEKKTDAAPIETNE